MDLAMGDGMPLAIDIAMTIARSIGSARAMGLDQAVSRSLLVGACRNEHRK